MKVAATMLALLACAALLGACGSQGVSVAKTSPYRRGAVLFRDHCAGCHTLKAAGASGTVGPNLDQAKPSAARVIDRVTHGKGGMPSFATRLSAQQIDDVAAYVVASAKR